MKELWSCLTNDMNRCYFTGSSIVERHHVFPAANRTKCEKYGFVVPLRPDLHPNGVHAGPRAKEIDTILKERCQEYYEAHYGTREDFRKEFGKSYL